MTKVQNPKCKTPTRLWGVSLHYFFNSESTQTPTACQILFSVKSILLLFERGEKCKVLRAKRAGSYIVTYFCRKTTFSQIARVGNLCYSGAVMTQKIIKTGNSAAVTIPSEMLKSLNLQIGDRAEAKMNFDEGSLTYVFPEIRQLRLEETRRKKK